jgi:hypothetical protein
LIHPPLPYPVSTAVSANPLILFSSPHIFFPLYFSPSSTYFSDVVPSAVMDLSELPQKTAGVVPVDATPLETQTSIPSQALSRFSLLRGRRSNRAKEDGGKEDKKLKERPKEKERDRDSEKGREREKEKESEKVKDVEREKKHLKEPSTERLSSVSASKIFPSLMKRAGSTVDLKKSSGSDIPQVTHGVHSAVMALS